MGAKRKSEEDDEAAEFDWRDAPRRPFKRGFLPYVGAEGTAAELKAQRKALGVTAVEDPAGADATPAPVESFEELGVLRPWTLDGLRDNSWLEPSPIEAQGLPILLAGQNLVGVCPLGAQKALAYLVPATTHVDDQRPLTDDDPGPIALVLVPSKEAAMKVAAQATKLLAHSARSEQHTEGIRVVAVYEGRGRKALGETGAHLVVGTPEQVHKLATANQMSLLRVTMLVLDQLDSFEDEATVKQVKDISGWVRPERQTAIFLEAWSEWAGEISSELCYSGGHPVSVTAKAKAGGAAAAVAVAPKRKVVKKVVKVAAPKKTEFPAEGAEEEFPEDWGDPESA